MRNTQPLFIIIAVLLALGAGVLITQTFERNGMMEHMTDEDMHKEMGEHMEEHMGEHEHSEAETAAKYEIYPADVVEKIRKNEDIVLLDVRTPEEYAEVHLKNAVLIPVQTLSAQTLAEAGIGADAKDKEIIIYCRSGARSKIAYEIMKSLGYTNIKSVAGGIIHWQEDEYPFTERGAYDTTRRTVHQTEEAQNTPRISLSRTFHDFGTIPQYGGPVKTSFEVTNTGTSELIIDTITTSCSCTSATTSATAIRPNDSATITVTFDPDFHEEPKGVFKRTVFIGSNDPQTPEAEFTIQVDIDEGV